MEGAGPVQLHAGRRRGTRARPEASRAHVFRPRRDHRAAGLHPARREGCDLGHPAPRAGRQPRRPRPRPPRQQRGVARSRPRVPQGRRRHGALSVEDDRRGAGEARGGDGRRPRRHGSGVRRRAGPDVVRARGPARADRRRQIPRRAGLGTDARHVLPRHRVRPRLGAWERVAPRRTHPRRGVRRPGAGRALARRLKGRRRLVHRRHRLGPGTVERVPRAVGVRRRGRPPRGRVRRDRAARPDPPPQRHDPLSDPRRVPRSRRDPSPHPRAVPLSTAAAPRLHGRLPRARPRRGVRRGVGHDDPRRVRSGGDERRRRKRRGRRLQARSARRPSPRPSRRRHRRPGERAPAGHRGRSRGSRPPSDPLCRVLGIARGDEAGVQRGLVPNG